MAEAILLHACCGPCAIMPVRQLIAEGYKLVLWFMNPNIQPLSEYLKRREAVSIAASRLNVEIIFDDAAWDMPSWLERQLPYAKSPRRCENCVDWRLEAAARAAIRLGIPNFSTTLLYSRYQPHDHIKETGNRLSTSEESPKFVYRDFRKFWQAGIDASIAWKIYRQAWCGCIFSENERYAKKLARLLQK